MAICLLASSRNRKCRKLMENGGGGEEREREREIVSHELFYKAITV